MSNIKHKITDGTLEFENLSIGNLRTGEKLTWDELRKVVMIATRFATNRPIETRSLDELRIGVKTFIEDHTGKETKRDREVNNLRVQLAACREYIERQNIEYNELRLAYNEATGVVSKQE